MTATNHMLAGALVAVAVKQPLLAVPLAFASHFVLDSLPHFGYPNHMGFGEALKKRLTIVMLGYDVLALILLILLFADKVSLLIVSCAFTAITPDLVWLYRYFFFERKGLPSPRGPITKFHQWVQWGERPWGIAVEVIFFSVGALTLYRLLS